MQVKHVTSGWKGLADVLNGMIEAINFNDPIEGDGIRIMDTGTGKLIMAAPPGKTAGAGVSAGGSGTGGSGGLLQGNFQVTLNDVAWKQVTVVDPSDCSQSTIYVLTQQAGNSVSLTASLTQTS